MKICDSTLCKKQAEYKNFMGESLCADCMSDELNEYKLSEDDFEELE